MSPEGPSAGQRSRTQRAVEREKVFGGDHCLPLLQELSKPVLTHADAWDPTEADIERVVRLEDEAMKTKLVRPDEEHREASESVVDYCVSVFRKALDGGDTGLDHASHEGVDIVHVDYPIVPEWSDATGKKRGKSEWVLPSGVKPDADMPCRILYLPGGGYVRNAPDDGYRPLTTRIAAATGLPLLAIDYHKAPLFRFPTPLKDAMAALRYVWLYDAQGRHRPAEKVFLIGDSAGAGLGLSILLNLSALRDKPEAPLLVPTAIVTISAFTDLSCTLPSYKSRAWDPEKKTGDPIFSHGNTPEQLEKDITYSRVLGDLYLDSVDLRVLQHPIASTAYAPDRLFNWDALPPMLMQVGNDEVMLDDTMFLYHRAKAQGWNIELEIYDRMWHDWVMYSEGCGGGKPLLPGLRAVESLAAFVAKFVDEGKEPAA
ncbi:Monoterpene epsilon-lactone hydrolase [Diplonema papillatum]|nr:Monoterpene epsilon-lactone hydrolase [Diplonema papillatum]